jgi:hypothetical protein
VKYANWVTGISLGIGLLVAVNQLQIPYYLFYPRTIQTILISSIYDYYLFLASSASVPCVFGLATISVWAVSFVLAILNVPFAVAVLYATVISAAVLEVFRSGARRVTLGEMLPSALTVFVLVEWSSICY